MRQKFSQSIDYALFTRTSHKRTRTISPSKTSSLLLKVIIKAKYGVKTTL